MTRAVSVEVVERAVTPAEAALADGALFTGFLCEVTPIAAIDGVSLGRSQRRSGPSRQLPRWLRHVRGGRIRLRNESARAVCFRLAQEVVLDLDLEIEDVKNKRLAVPVEI